jgi:CRISPR-associated protein Cmr3
MTWLFIEPTDVWFFRDGRPFPAGGGYTARGVFPPSPMTLQGALRSLVLAQSNVDWGAFRNSIGVETSAVAAQIGSPTCLGAFNMRGPFLARLIEDRVERLAPMPADAFVAQRSPDGQEVTYAAFCPSQNINFGANWPSAALRPLWPPDGARKDAPSGNWWLPPESLIDYLNDQEFSALTERPLYDHEPRLGIALDYGRRRPREGMLYQTEFVRPRLDVGLLVWLDPAIVIPSSGWLALGGQARAARYGVVPENSVQLGLPSLQPTQRIKLLLLTPAFFDGGWQPSNGAWSALLGMQGARLVAVALGRPCLLGGWDVARRGHKEMCAYAPAGSVYYFECDQPVGVSAGPLTQTPPGALPHDRLGFGQVAAGTWRWLEEDNIA